MSELSDYEATIVDLPQVELKNSGEPGRKKGWAGKPASWLLRDVWCAEYWAESARGEEPLKNGGSKQNFVAHTKFTVTDER